MDANAWINLVIASVAVVGFIVSLHFSRKSLKQAKVLNDDTLKQTEKLFKKQCDIQLFDKRYEIIEEYLSLLLNGELLDIKSLKTLTQLHAKTGLLFDANYCVDINKLYMEILAYHTDKKPMPDYTDIYKEEILELGNKVTKESVFAFYVSRCVKSLREQIDIF